MITLISLVALSTGIADTTGLSAWQTDYQTALAHGARQHKPLAVFLAPGQEGWEMLWKNGAFRRDVQQLLEASYVPVFIDTTTAQGKELAASFELPGGLGLVLSDREGHYQTFRHEGLLAPEHLLRALDRHANFEGSVRVTESLLAFQEISSPDASAAPVPIQPVTSNCSH